MTALTWSEALALKQPRMDQTHREFIGLLQGLADARSAGLPDLVPPLQGLLAHTEAHFAQEERWMADIGFARENCHSMQHAQVLHVLREVIKRRDDEDHGSLVDVLVEELGRWFVAHAQMMDAALAQLMVERGYDPDTGAMLNAPAPQHEPITGCGGSRCS